MTRQNRTIASFLISVVLFLAHTSQLMAQPKLMSGQPTICIRLPTQPKTKCRKRILASAIAPQDYADKIDDLFNSFILHNSTIKDLEKKFPKYLPVAYFEVMANAQQGVDKSLTSLKLLANKFPKYFKVDYLVILLAEK